MPANTCSRPGCNRTLRSNNTKGVCSDINVCEGTAPAESVGGFSAADLADDDELGTSSAPKATIKPRGPKKPKLKIERDPAADAAGDDRLKEFREVEAAKKTLERFRELARALNFHPDITLAGFAQTFIDRAHRAVTGPRLIGMYTQPGGAPVPRTREEAAAAWEGVLRANVKQDSTVATASEHPGKCGIVGCEQPGYAIHRDIDPAGNAVELCQAHHDQREAERQPAAAVGGGLK